MSAKTCLLQTAQAHLPAAQQAPGPKQPADLAAVPPPDKKKSVWTAPNTKQNPSVMETPNILESRGGAGKGKRGGKGTQVGPQMAAGARVQAGAGADQPAMLLNQQQMQTC